MKVQEARNLSVKSEEGLGKVLNQIYEEVRSAAKLGEVECIIKFTDGELKGLCGAVERVLTEDGFSIGEIIDEPWYATIQLKWA